MNREYDERITEAIRQCVMNDEGLYHAITDMAEEVIRDGIDNPGFVISGAIRDFVYEQMEDGHKLLISTAVSLVYSLTDWVAIAQSVIEDV